MILAIALGGLTFFILRYNGAAEMNRTTWGNNMFFAYLGGITGSLMVFMLSKVISSYVGTISNVRTISRNTMFIIFFHWFLLRILSVFVNRVCDSGGINTLEIICVSFLLLTFVLAFSKIIIDYGIVKYPILYGKYKG